MISPPQSIEQLFLAARELSQADRRAFLDQACRKSPELRRLVEQRLAADTTQDHASATPSDSLPGLSGPSHGGRFAPGQVIAVRFTVIRYIARGGMGEVYEVEDRFLQGVHVALKMILPEIAGDTGSSRRFEQEVLLARKVTHPNLCPIYDIARSDDPPPPFLFLTMKLLSGETLSSRLQQPESFSREEKITIFRQMVAGLSAIHLAGVIHRDIKPNNVMLDYSGPELCLSIMDFGLARLHESEVTIGTGSLVAGTPGYMAPEVLRGQGPSQATDLFALGVLLHQVMTGERPRSAALSATVEPSPALDTADVPPALIHAVKEFLSSDPNRRCAAFEQFRSGSGGALAPWTTTSVSRGGLMSRRHFVAGSALVAGAAVGGIIWKRDRLNNLFHPLPDKRFVALLDWPPVNAGLKPMLLGVIDAIASELARAEAFDRNLLIIAPSRTSTDLTTPDQLNEARDSLGANLVLAASGVPRSGDMHLSLRVLDSSSTRTLRERQIRVPLDQQKSLPEKAVRAAADLLDITRYKPDDQRSKVGTNSPEAYNTFLAAESLMKQENDEGLDAAIEKYQQAIEIDPRYAAAQAKLSWAYLRSYGIHGNAAALMLASDNSKSAIRFDPSLVEAHLALASVYQQTGDDQSAWREMSKALSLDPSNPHTLTYQANFFAAENRWSEAEQTFDRVLSLRPNYWLGHQEMGVLLNNEGKYREALMQFRSASLASPRNALAVKNIGSTYLQLGNLPEALANLNASFALKPDDEAAVSLAELFRVQRKYPEAIDFAQKAVKLDPNEAAHWLELGDVYSDAEKFGNQAMDAYRQAAATQEEQLQTSPKYGPGWMLLALCRVKAGQPATASTLISRAESLHADDMDSQLNKVRILELIGRRDEALATIKRCLGRGSTLFQIETMPDLEKLRASPEYGTIKSSTASATQLSL